MDCANSTAMNVKKLDGALLNAWVAKAAGLALAPVDPRPGDDHDPDSGFWHPVTYSPANDWSQGGPIVTNEWYAIEDMLLEWFGAEWPHIHAIVENPLKWFMRAYVATQYGNEVEERSSVHAEISGASDKPTSRVTQWLSQVHW